MTVRGFVTLNGKRVGGGRIMFQPVAGDKPSPRAEARSGDIARDGTYTLQTLVGKNLVTVEGKGIPDNQTPVVLYPGLESVPIVLSSKGKGR